MFKSSKQRRKNVPVKDILDKVQKLFSSSFKKENISVEVVAIGQPLTAKTTDAVLLQLFINLFDNSIYWLRSKTSGKRQIEIRLDGDDYQLVFADNGPGIKADDAPYIFEPCFCLVREICG